MKRDGAADTTLQGVPSDRENSQKITSKGLAKTATGYGGMILKGLPNSLTWFTT